MLSEHRPKPTGLHLVLSRLGATGLKRIAGTGAAVKGVKCLLPDVLDEIYKKRESSGGLFALSDVFFVLWINSTQYSEHFLSVNST